MILAANPLQAEFYLSAAGFGGLVVLAVILFAETGLLIGFFLPGDTLLLYAGSRTVLDDHGHKPLFSFGAVAVAGIIGAIAGAQTGFFIGRRVGPRVFDKGSRRERVVRAERVLHRVGEGRAVVASRFIPVVRTFMNPAVGLTKYPAQRFSIWNAVGAVIWVPPVLLIGREVGQKFPLDKIVVAVVVLSLAAAAVGAIRERRKARATR